MTANGDLLHHLGRIATQMEVSERLAVDPLGFVPRSAPQERQELVAYVAAMLAFGNVKAIGQSVDRVVRHLDCLDRLKTGHRWVRAPDLRDVVRRLQSLQSEYGSLANAFTRGYVPGDMKSSIAHFSELVRQELTLTRGVSYLTSTPATGGACKRFNLFLRWMVRDKGFDLGLWPQVSPSDLIAPVDVHVLRFAKLYGVTQRATVSWRTAEEITEFFKTLDSTDPLRFDFAISHYGMAHGWDNVVPTATMLPP